MSRGKEDGLNLSALEEWEPTQVEVPLDRAAVLVPIIHSSTGVDLLFTKRADHLGEHPGQMSFPGGGHEAQDADLLETALREADEEIGLTRDEVDINGRLDDIETVTDYVVSPFVGTVADRIYQPDEREVAEVVRLPLADLLDCQNFEADVREHPQLGEITIHYFRVNGYTVWGATGRILVQFLQLTTDWEAAEATHQSTES